MLATLLCKDAQDWWHSDQAADGLRRGYLQAACQLTDAAAACWQHHELQLWWLSVSWGVAEAVTSLREAALASHFA